MASGVKVKGFSRTIQKIDNIRKKIPSASGRFIYRLVEKGANFARSKAPVRTGAMVMATNARLLDKYKGVVISARPKNSKVPYNVMIDEGTVSWARMYPSKLGFMKKTFAYMQQELNKDKRLLIKRIVK